jgi:hypothetical protein
MGTATTPSSIPVKPHSSHSRVRATLLALSLQAELKLKAVSLP